jgi:hypothetical protein
LRSQQCASQADAGYCVRTLIAPSGKVPRGSGHGHGHQAPRGKCHYMERVGASGRPGYRWKALRELSRSNRVRIEVTGVAKLWERPTSLDLVRGAREHGARCMMQLVPPLQPLPGGISACLPRHANRVGRLSFVNARRYSLVVHERPRDLLDRVLVESS